MKQKLNILIWRRITNSDDDRRKKKYYHLIKFHQKELTRQRVKKKKNCAIQIVEIWAINSFQRAIQTHTRTPTIAMHLLHTETCDVFLMFIQYFSSFFLSFSLKLSWSHWKFINPQLIHGSHLIEIYYYKCQQFLFFHSNSNESWPTNTVILINIK